MMLWSSLLLALTCVRASLALAPTPPSPLPRRQDHAVPSSSLPFANRTEALLIGNSYAGHITVRKTAKHHAALFYWFFRAERDPNTAPLVIWIQGGPGGSSIEDGLFFEMGPLRVQEPGGGKFTLSRNPHSWTTKYNMLFIDQPVGTGYSFVDPPSPARAPDRVHDFWTSQLLAGRTRVQQHAARPAHPPLVMQGGASEALAPETESDAPGFRDGYAASEAAVSRDLIVFMQAFYSMFPEMHKVDLHLTSESYGGKYVPEIATAIADYNDALPADKQNLHIPLKTLAIGNQWTDPYTQIGVHPDHFLQVGLIDDIQAGLLATPIAAAREAVLKQDWLGGLEARIEMFDMLSVFTGGINWYDFRLLNRPLAVDHIERFLLLNSTKKALHVDSPYEFGTDYAVMANLADDIMKTTKPLFPALFKRYKVLLYQGNYDLRDGVTSNTRWIETIDWDGRVGFKYAPRMVWRSTGGLLQGYATQWANLTRVVLTGCGHLAPADEGCPEASLDMISRHIDQDSFI